MSGAHTNSSREPRASSEHALCSSGGVRHAAPLLLVALAGLDGCVAFANRPLHHGGGFHHHGGSYGLIEAAAELVVAGIQLAVEAGEHADAQSDAREAVASEPEEPPQVDPAPPLREDDRSTMKPPLVGAGRSFPRADADASASLGAVYAGRCRGTSHGDAAATLLFAMSGAVREVDVWGPGAADPVVAECARARLRTARVLPFDSDEPQRVDVSFVVH
jgi:hypothetical protein